MIFQGRTRKRARLIRFVLDYPLGALGGGVVLSFVLLGLLAPVIAPYQPNAISALESMSPPNAEHWLGTDNLGRDLLSRVIFGARTSLLISLAGIAIALVFGTGMGLIASYYRWIDAPVMRLVDVMLAFPPIIVALTIVAMLGTGIWNIVLAIAVGEIPQYARVAHGQGASLKEQPFIHAAKLTGESDRAILFWYMLPNCRASLIVQTSLLAPGAVFTTATLSFLGLGIPAPTAEWGAMLQGSLTWAPLGIHVMLFPGLALLLVVLGFNLLGDSLRDALDPRLQGTHA